MILVHRAGSDTIFVQTCYLHKGSCLVGFIQELQWEMGSVFLVLYYENNSRTCYYFMADPMKSDHQASSVLGICDKLRKKKKLDSCLNESYLNKRILGLSPYVLGDFNLGFYSSQK